MKTDSHSIARPPVRLQHRQCRTADHPARIGLRPRRLAMGGDRLCPHVWVLALVGGACRRPAGAAALTYAGALALWAGLAELWPGPLPAHADPLAPAAGGRRGVRLSLGALAADDEQCGGSGTQPGA